jgi:hypothetical protein
MKRIWKVSNVLCSTDLESYSLHFISYSKDYNTEDWKVNVLQNKIKDESLEKGKVIWM